ncbi:S1 family peptidase [Streptomyces violaceus]|uniref:S1 family peptidase n=1 Tax=Streptomyces violaceus TaxID=1936 RepID=UPI0038B5AA6B
MVRKARGTSKLVEHNAAELEAVHGELDELAGISNTSWGVDPSSNQVSVKIYDGVSSAERARIERVAADHGDAVRIERRPGQAGAYCLCHARWPWHRFCRLHVQRWVQRSERFG